MEILAEQCKVCCEIVEISLMHIPMGVCMRCAPKPIHNKEKFDNILKDIKLQFLGGESGRIGDEF